MVVRGSVRTAFAGAAVGGAVSSVAGRTGAVVLAESDVTNLAADLSALQTQTAIQQAQFSSVLAANASFAVAQGLVFSPNATPTKLDSTAGSALVGPTDIAIAAQTAIATTIASLADATNPKWVAIEIDTAGATQFNQGTAAASPALPAFTASRVPVYLIYVPANATNVDTLLTTNNGLAKLYDIRTIRSGPSPSGWQYEQNTWVFSSSTTGAGGGLITFTVTGVDATGYLKVGTKVSWNDGTNVPGYGVVASAAFSTNTTVTLIKQSDYVMANATIKYARYSYAQSPQGFPTWFNYSPTLSGWLTGAPTALTNVASSNPPVTDSLLTKTAHGLVNGYKIKPTGLVNTTGITNGTTYFVVTATANTFQLATTFGGTPITLGGTQDTAITITPQAGTDPPAVAVYKWKTDGRSITVIMRNQNVGTSSSTTHSITVPVASITLSGMRWYNMIDVVDNATEQSGFAFVGSAATTILFGLSTSTTFGATNNNTASGSSAINGPVTYEF